MIRTYKDFPEIGVNFADLAEIYESLADFTNLVDSMDDFLVDLFGPERACNLVGVDARGFVPAAALATRGYQLLLARKLGKLPKRPTISAKGKSEYHEVELEMSQPSGMIDRGRPCVIVDDVLATGESALATARIVEAMDMQVGAFLFAAEIHGLPAPGWLHLNESYASYGGIPIFSWREVKE